MSKWLGVFAPAVTTYLDARPATAAALSVLLVLYERDDFDELLKVLRTDPPAEADARTPQEA
ncbi:MAG: hypothetical protein JO243_10720 [Solirubrobacterales bacterium]|nr:hypothetical protein [Solirubrobacterales bacterium]